MSYTIMNDMYKNDILKDDMVTGEYLNVKSSGYGGEEVCDILDSIKLNFKWFSLKIQIIRNLHLKINLTQWPIVI